MERRAAAGWVVGLAASWIWMTRLLDSGAAAVVGDRSMEWDGWGGGGWIDGLLICEWMDDLS